MSNKELIKQNAKFGYSVGMALIVIFALRVLLKHRYAWTLAGAGALLCVFAWIKPLWLNLLRSGWDKVGYALGIVNSAVLLTGFYFLILTPIALIRRLCGHHNMKLKHENGRSYWQVYKAENNGSMKNQF